MKRKPGSINHIIYWLFIFQVCISSCNKSNTKDEKIGFLGFYLDMDYLKVRSIMDSLLKIKELQYIETTDLVGHKQTNLYYMYSEISPSLCAKVNLKGAFIVDQRLTSIQLTLCNRSNKGEQKFSLSVGLDELNKIFELYKLKYGKPTLLGPGPQYDWLSKKIPGIYLPGPKGRLIWDKIYIWDKGNYIIYFDFGFPENANKPITETDGHVSPDSTGVPIILFNFTEDYINTLLEKGGKTNEEMKGE